MIVESRDTPELYKYKYEAGKFSLLWKKPRPATAEKFCYPLFATDGDIYTHSDGLSKHHRHSGDLLLKASHKGELRLSMSQDRRAIRKMKYGE